MISYDEYCHLHEGSFASVESADDDLSLHWAFPARKIICDLLGALAIAASAFIVGHYAFPSTTVITCTPNYSHGQEYLNNCQTVGR